MKTRDRITSAIEALGVASPKAIADHIDEPSVVVRRQLQRLLAHGIVQVHDATGGYYMSDAPSRTGYLRVPVHAREAA